MRRRNTKVLVLSVITGLLGLGVVLGVVGAIFDVAPVRTITTTTSSSTTAPPPGAAELGPAGEQLDALLEIGRGTTYHATYTVEDPALNGIVQSVEVWRRGTDHFRYDIIEKAANGTRRQSYVTAGATKRFCETLNGTQTCQIKRELPGELSAEFIRSVTEDEGTELSTSNDDIAGFQARCFTAEGIGSLCLTTDGVMLRLDLRSAVVTAALIEDEVPEAAFDVSG